jgi:four helix bundle protein
MSYVEALPIYRAAMDVVVAVDAAVRGFPRYHKYALGTQLRQASLEALLNVQRAHPKQARAAGLARLCASIEELKLLLQAGKEVSAFASYGQFAELMKRVVSLARQAEAWRAHERKRQNTPHPRPEPR